jgi:ABC-type uncharacterized transport system auxiliary subunit
MTLGRLIAIATTCCLLAACGTTPESHNIRLDLASTLTPAPRPLAGTLQVLPFTARGLLNERRLVYTDASAPQQRRQSASFFWEEPPAQAATIVAVAGLRSSGVASAVYAPDQPGTSDYILAARIDRFELEQSTVRVALNVSVLTVDGRKPILLQEVCGGADVSGSNGGSVARAFDAAFQQTLNNLVQALGSPGAAQASAC